MSNILSLRNIYKSFNQGEQKLEVLRGVNFDINEGEVVALIGPSGSGKSTLLQIAGLLEVPTSGNILLNGQDCSKQSEAKEKSGWLLNKMKLDNRLTHRPAELSGGEQQRVAIARALANTPKMLLADEPTGNLDPKTADIVFEALMNIIKETGLAALIATHNMELAKAMDKQVGLEEGRLIELGISSIIGSNNFY